MSRLLMVCGMITLLIGAACTIAVGLGHTYPPLDLVRAAGLAYCQTQVCLRGIALGTDWKNAVEKLTPNADYSGRDALQVDTSDFFYDMTTLDNNKTIIGQIGSAPANGFSLLLGDIVGHYGAPCLVSYLLRENGDVQITLIYPYFVVTTPRFDFKMRATLSDDPARSRLFPKMPIEFTEFHFAQNKCVLSNPDQPLPPDEHESYWHGFGWLR